VDRVVWKQMNFWIMDVVIQGPPGPIGPAGIPGHDGRPGVQGEAGTVGQPVSL
jgi:hypothetical protein